MFIWIIKNRKDFLNTFCVQSVSSVIDIIEWNLFNEVDCSASVIPPKTVTIMKNITLNFLNQDLFKDLNEADKNKLIGIAMLSPLFIFFILLDWDISILIFILLSFAAAVTGFVFAKTKYGKALVSKEEELYHKMIAETSEDIVFIHRVKDKTNVFITPSVENVLGYAQERVVNRQSAFLVHPEDRKKMTKLIAFKSLRQETVLKTNLRIQEKGKEYKWMELRVTPIVSDSGEIEYAVLKFKDVSQQKELEKVSRMFAEELMRKEPNLQSENQVSDQLVSLMTSHELKEPLRTITSYIRFFDQRYSDDLDKEGKECLHFVHDAALRMQQMINDITDFFKMGGDQMVLKRVDTQKLVAGVIRMLGTRIKEQKASVIVGMLPKVIADPRQLQHIFQNLLDNALKYSKGKTEIWIACKKKTSHWEFEIRDNGIGISKEYKDAVFKIFRRLHTVDQYNGTGVGLTICQKVIDNHNGNLWLKSDGPNKGTSFFFTIPFEPSVNVFDKRKIEIHN